MLSAMGTAQRDLLTKVVAEAVGMFALIFIGAGSIVVGADLTGVALAHGLGHRRHGVRRSGTSPAATSTRP